MRQSLNRSFLFHDYLLTDAYGLLTTSIRIVSAKGLVLQTVVYHIYTGVYKISCENFWRSDAGCCLGAAVQHVFHDPAFGIMGGDGLIALWATVVGGIPVVQLAVKGAAVPLPVERHGGSAVFTSLRDDWRIIQHGALSFLS